ncbi:helix-turn-helix transcriptional regulator [Lysinibacillus macroides]|uniref:helix-turn-helix domain-containing protein n=1 Tax=Lysinibacillus macroides TaxID=33935 RepID=UPI0006B57BAA|nr:helix-turn-helix transcriptional regulator [Lysinibacillus macroides]QPR69615.1 helix-turn-helix transcriptional regulator [Lysinibacillus macroides]
MRALSLDFAKVLKKFRKDAKLTQEEMACQLNMTQSHVSKYEQGRKIIDLETFLKWAQITNAEAQAAIIMFGTDVIAHASQLISVVPAFIWVLIQF